MKTAYKVEEEEGNIRLIINGVRAFCYRDYKCTCSDGCPAFNFEEGSQGKVVLHCLQRTIFLTKEQPVQFFTKATPIQGLLSSKQYLKE